MGSHRTHAPKAVVSPDVVASFPPRPVNIGKRRRLLNINGEPRNFVIRDEIQRPQTSLPNKLIVFQKIEIEEDKRIEYRLGYYMIGVKPGGKGRWVWGQFCLLIPAEDLHPLLDEAKHRGWW